MHRNHFRITTPLCHLTGIYCGNYVVSSVVNCTSCTALMYNAALNRPSYQSSVYHDSYGDHPAGLANDGSRETYHYRDDVPRCSHTDRETNPWWAVDLGRPLTVYRVDLTNRQSDFYGTVALLWTLCVFMVDCKSKRRNTVYHIFVILPYEAFIKRHIGLHRESEKHPNRVLW